MMPPRWSPPWLRRWFNPHNLTRLHLAESAGRYGHVIGEHSYGAPQLKFAGEAKLTIGRYCSFADQVQIMLGGEHRLDFVTTYPFGAFPQWPKDGPARHSRTRGDVTIGSDVWVGTGAMILSGVTIGHGAVIGARAVVSRSVAPYAIVAGNPAREIHKRFDEVSINALLETQWWELPDPVVAGLIPMLQGDDIGRAISAIRAARET